MPTTTTTIKSYKGLKSIQSNANRVQYNDIISKTTRRKKKIKVNNFATCDIVIDNLKRRCFQ